MKRSELVKVFQDAGVEADKIDDLVNSIMDSNGKDINNTRNSLQNEIESLKAENESLKASNTELTTKNDSYKDYEELKQFKADFEANQEKQLKTDYLKSVGCKHPDLFVDKIDWSKASYDNENKTYKGVEDALKGIKETYKDMFEVKDEGIQVKGKEQLASKGQGESDFMAWYKAQNPNLKIN